ncbi:Kazrin-A [Trichinella zimbabwensis]|uniref:Kazrin-A n=1 Tax=Trichinella zimbabwensis TaxID=268475 RepID=A0A0V1HNY6_9BILA|nr:Kazrin-A [Trichinella zimbabwensis]KRZ11938.1 Kazrin-A [Trichinella zimbabwensis]
MVDSNSQKMKLEETIEILDYLQKEVSQLEESAKAKNTPSDNNPYPSTVEFCFIRSLLTETRNQCCLLASDNYLFNTHLNREINRCHNQLNSLRKEVAFAKRCVDDLEESMMINDSPPQSDMDSQEHELERKIYCLCDENAHLKAELRLLQRQIFLLKKEEGNSMNSTETAAATPTTPTTEDDICRSKSGINANEQICTDIAELQHELQQAREALFATKADQKRLRHEKAELFNQMKELCDALEKKESHIKEFVRTLEQRVQESDMQTKQLLWEKQKLEAEYSKAAEQLSKANQQLNIQKQDLTKEQQENSRLQASLKEMQGRFLLLTGKTVYNCEGANSVSLGSVVAVQSDDDDESSPVTDSEEPHFLANGGFSQHLKSSSESTLKESGAAFERIPFAYSFRRCRSRKDAHAEDNGNRLSKLLHFAKTKAKGCESLDSFSEHDPITQELNLAERADYLLRARSMPLSQWKLAHITAWLRLEMGMIHYVKAFESNVKSGKALAELSDFEMENTLGIANPMHKKKLRLALDEYPSIRV